MKLNIVYIYFERKWSTNEIFVFELFMYYYVGLYCGHPVVGALVQWLAGAVSCWQERKAENNTWKLGADSDSGRYKLEQSAQQAAQ